MNKKSIIFWVLYAALLVFLYILSATDLIIKENETKVYSISILVDGISGENFENMKKVCVFKNIHEIEKVRELEKSSRISKKNSSMISKSSLFLKKADRV